MASHESGNSTPLPGSGYVETTARFSPLDSISPEKPPVYDHSQSLPDLGQVDALQSDTERDQLLRDATFSWKRYWAIPLYGLGFLAHRRYRAWRPRAIPSMTTIRLPELYGTLAFGELASIEAHRLAGNEGEDITRAWVRCYAWFMKDVFREHQKAAAQRGADEVSDTYDLSLLTMSSLSPRALFQRYTRTWLSGNESRTFVSRNVFDHFVEQWVSIHDGDVLITYVAEEIERQYHDDEADLITFFSPRQWSLADFLPYQISDLVNRRPFKMSDALYLPLASSVLLGMWRRMTAPRAFSTLCLNGIQRLLFYVYAYRTLGAHYRHEASLDTFDHPNSVAWAAYRAYQAAYGGDSGSQSSSPSSDASNPESEAENQQEPTKH